MYTSVKKGKSPVGETTRASRSKADPPDISLGRRAESQLWGPLRKSFSSRIGRRGPGPPFLSAQGARGSAWDTPNWPRSPPPTPGAPERAAGWLGQRRPVPQRMSAGRGAVPGHRSHREARTRGAAPEGDERLLPGCRGATRGAAEDRRRGQGRPEVHGARTHLGPWKQDACDSPLPAPPPAQCPLRAEAASPRGADAQPTRLRKILESAVGNLEDMRHPCPRDLPSPPGGRGDRGGASLRPGPPSVAPALRRLALRSARAPRATRLWLSSTCPRPRPGALCARGQARNAARKRLRSLSFNSVEGTKTPMCANELSFHKPVQLESSCEAG